MWATASSTPSAVARQTSGHGVGSRPSSRAIALESGVFESHFNLGNIFHDLGRYKEAQECYREALRINPTYADAHFYLAVSLEKSGLSPEARLHWRAYQELAPDGEWVHLAQEFCD